MKELIVEATIESLTKVIDFVYEELVQKTCPQELRDTIGLAVEEVFTNIVNNAYQPAAGNAAISIAVGEEAVIRFTDTGKPYNPLERPEPDLNKPLMEREIGGLGIFLVKKIMDKVEYGRIDDKNVLVIRKKIE